MPLRRSLRNQSLNGNIEYFAYLTSPSSKILLRIVFVFNSCCSIFWMDIYKKSLSKAFIVFKIIYTSVNVDYLQSWWLYISVYFLFGVMILTIIILSAVYHLCNTWPFFHHLSLQIYTEETYPKHCLKTMDFADLYKMQLILCSSVLCRLDITENTVDHLLHIFVQV